MGARIFFISCLAVFLSGCMLDDSAPVHSVFRPENGAYAHVRVVYVTDRAADAAAAGGFGSRWAGRASCGVATAEIPPASLPGEDVKWGYISRTDPTACTTAAGPRVRLAGAVAALRTQAKLRHCRSVFLFVHGFHTGFDSAVLRAAQLSHDAGTGCAVAAFSWTSAVRLDRYIPDAERSSYARPLLAEFLHELADAGLDVSVVAHSMGARMTLATLAGFALDRDPPPRGFVSQLVLAAADIGAAKSDGDALRLLNAAAPFVRRTTVYVSRHDGMMKISRDAHGGVPRLGGAPAAAESQIADDRNHLVDIVDASDVPADVFGHSYLAMSYEAMYDLAAVLRGVPLAVRLQGRDGQPPTLRRDADRAALATHRAPRLITRILVPAISVLP